MPNYSPAHLKGGESKLGPRDKMFALVKLGLVDIIEVSANDMARYVEEKEPAYMVWATKQHGRDKAASFKALIENIDELYTMYSAHQQHLLSVPSLTATIKKDLEAILILGSYQDNDEKLNEILETLTHPQCFSSNKSIYQRSESFKNLPDHEIWRYMSVEFVKKLLDPFYSKRESGKRGPGRSTLDPVALEQRRIFDDSKAEDELARLQNINDIENNAIEVLDDSNIYTQGVLGKDLKASAEGMVDRLDVHLTIVATHNETKFHNLFDRIKSARQTIIRNCLTEKWAQQRVGVQSGKPVTQSPAESSKKRGRTGSLKAGEVSETARKSDLRRTYRNSIDSAFKTGVKALKTIFMIGRPAVPEGEMEIDVHSNQEKLQAADTSIAELESKLLEAYKARTQLKHDEGISDKESCDTYMFSTMLLNMSMAKDENVQVAVGNRLGDLSPSAELKSDVDFAAQILMHRSKLNAVRRQGQETTNKKVKTSLILKGERYSTLPQKGTTYVGVVQVVPSFEMVTSTLDAVAASSSSSSSLSAMNRE